MPEIDEGTKVNHQQPFTIRNPLSRFRISGDRAIFNQIVCDMLENGGELSPSSHWDWNLGRESTPNQEEEAGYTDDLYEEKYRELEMMLKPLVGVTGMKPISEAEVSKYKEFLRSIDHLGMLPANILVHGQSNDWRETDLGSVMDANLISAYFGEHHVDRRLKVCEVGGGYGRLAEAMVGVLSESIHYVLVDAVPGSLMYAYLYLKQQFPELKVGSYYRGDAYSEKYDFYVIPAWQMQQLPITFFDICINVESMQEMEQHHVNHYFSLFDCITIDNGLIYLSNARDYVFRGEWPVPVHWESLFLNNTPRSWTANHPTHVLRKSTGDYSMQRSILEGVFTQQIAAWRDRQIIQELKLNIADRDRIYFELQQKIDRLSGEVGIDADPRGDKSIKA